MSNLYEFTDGNIEEQIDRYYDYYLDLFQECTNYINEKEIHRTRMPDVDGIDYSYFHMITKDYNPKDKYICPRDSFKSFLCEHPFEYNPWIEKKYPREICPSRMLASTCLEGFFNKTLLIWENDISSNGNKRRIKCYCIEDDYLVVLEEKTDGRVFIITGYPIEFKNRREKLMKEYKKSLSSCPKYITKTVRK